MSQQDSHIQLGTIQGVFGIKGWLKIFSYCRPKPQILDYPSWELRTSDQSTRYELQEGKPHGNGIIAKLKTIEDRTQAETLKGAEIWIEKSKLPDLDGAEFYWFQLEGLSVLNLEGEKFGVVYKIMETGANDVLVVREENSKNEILIPYVHEQVVKQVDLAEKTITVDWQKDY